MLRIALAQLSAGEDRLRNLDRALEMMRRAHQAGAGLIVFPELALERFFPQFRREEAAGRSAPEAEPIPGSTADRIAAMARELSLVTIFNMYEIDQHGRTFDSSPIFDADGSLRGVTRMAHITDFEGFHEQGYYAPADAGPAVYETSVGRIGVAICYDRHYPEYMRLLGLRGAQVVVVPQAGALGEWPEGLFEAELRTAAFQNGYWVALCNRVGPEERITFAGESFVCDPEGQIAARAPGMEEYLLLADLDTKRCERSTARRLFWKDRRPELYVDLSSPA